MPPTPEGVAYLADHDETDTRADGTHITCHQITTQEGIRAAWHAWRYMKKIGIP